jgi:serine/threonine-protein kinase
MERRVAERYLLGAQIGAGGTARVYAALDERLGRQVAIKLLDAGLAASADPGGRDRFLREGPTSASFHHRHAVTVFDVGADDRDLYIVMELVEGQSLAERLAATGPLPIGEATRITGHVLAALAAAHAVGIIHRDVKPANVLLGADGDTKLADFGIAKRFDDLAESVTMAGTVIGTPRYMAPEQVAGAPATAATDIYATGLLLYEMLTGRSPFTGDSVAAVAARQRSRTAPDVRALRPEVSPALAATVARSLAREPSDRFPTASAMIADLENAWSPPKDRSPESMVETQLIGAAAPAVVGERIGDTQTWAASDPAPAAAPVASPAPSVSPPTPSPPRRHSRRMLVAAGLTVLALVGVVTAVALRDSGESGPFPTTGIGNSTVVTTTTAPAKDIIPGFAATDDLEVFATQLEDEPLLVGTAGPDLADALRKLLDEHSVRKQRDRAVELSKWMIDWVDHDELSSDIADALDVLLKPLTDKAGA